MPRIDYLEGIDKLYFKGEKKNENVNEIKKKLSFSVLFSLYLFWVFSIFMIQKYHKMII